METRITVLIAIATGLAVISYNTPHIYKKVFIPALTVLGSIYLLTLAWFNGYMTAYTIVVPYIDYSKISQANKAYEALKINGDFFLYVFASFAYLGFLRWLSSEVIKHKEQKEIK